MVKYVYCGLYDIDLHGKTYAEFDGEHPTMIVQTKKEPKMYIVIPFTSYEPERWQKLKKKCVVGLNLQILLQGLIE